MNIGIVWIQNYRSRQASLRLSRACATGFGRAFQGSTVVEHSETTAFDALFQRPAVISAMDMVYFSGHGSDDGPIFEVMNRNDGLAKFTEVALGGLLRIAVFDCCRALKPGDLWIRGFQGLRWLLGFTDDVFQSADRGRIFGEFLLDRPAKPIDEAWRRAAIETDEPGIPSSFVRSLDTGGEIPADTLADLPHPTTPRFFVFATEVREDSGPTAGAEERRGQVKLFSIQSPGWTGESLADICVRLGVDEDPQVNTKDFHRFGGGALDIFRASDSVWWSRARYRQDLFGASPELPSPEEAVELAKRFLVEKSFVPAEIREIWTARTQETHGDGDGRRKEIASARHVHVTYQLDGLPVMGPGAQTRVTFQSRQIDAFFQLWQRPVPTSMEVEVIDADEAERRLRNDDTFRNVSSHLSIASRRLGYYTPLARQRADYLLPVWAIRGKVTTDAAVYGFVRYVPAAKSVPPRLLREGSVFNLSGVFP